MIQEINLKKEALKVLGGLLYVSVIIFTIVYLNMSFWQVYGFLMGISLFWNLIKWVVKKQKPSIKSILKSAILLLMIMYLFKLINLYIPGFLGYSLGILIIVAIMLYSRRKRWLDVKWYIEKRIWGQRIKDLPKDYWKN